MTYVSPDTGSSPESLPFGPDVRQSPVAQPEFGPSFTYDLPKGSVPVPAEVWRESENRHQRAVDDLTAGHRQRAQAGVPHPVEDFLFTYYSHRPNQLRRWHAGVGVSLAQATEREHWRFYRAHTDGSVTLDVGAFLLERAPRLSLVRRTLTQTLGSLGQFGCFGLHEWAMVYREADRRHSRVPLRLSRASTDAVVRDGVLRCSHFDAVRFFSPAAQPLNTLDPAAVPALRREQPGCLHAGMDLYKWAYQLSPAISSDLLLDCFRLARRIRELDMRASPYDLADDGYAPVRIETPEGKAEYVAAQRAFAAEGQALRVRLLEALEPLAPPLPR